MFPTHDREKLAAIRLEAYALLETHATSQVMEVPKSGWPTSIASLGPKVVWVRQDGVELLMKPGFDGGYGYFIPRRGHGQMLPKNFENLGEGVYWHGPL